MWNFIALMSAVGFFVLFVEQITAAGADPSRPTIHPLRKPGPPRPEPRDSVTIATRGTDILLRYIDAEGAHTERVVTLNAVEGTVAADGAMAIDTLHTYCRLRRMPRTFKMRHVGALYDPHTGQPIRHVLEYVGYRASLPAQKDLCQATKAPIQPVIRPSGKRQRALT